ncbi:MAG: hypothetical protein N3A54_07115, partial [Patescibacteria group bacterium]|nr:hypothetical protein [Patescibacteria group bacterium]
MSESEDDICFKHKKGRLDHAYIKPTTKSKSISPITDSGMKSEKEKMLSGQLYRATDPELAKEREHARKLTRLLNQTLETEHERRVSLLKELFGSTGEHVYVEPPFYCDYGYN